MIRLLHAFWYKEDIFHIGISSHAFKKKKKEGQSIFILLLFFKCLYLNIVSMPEWHILKWHVLNSFRAKLEQKYCCFILIKTETWETPLNHSGKN